jgi:galactonate dehydratase
LADVHRIALAPHNPTGPVSTAASIEFGFSQPQYVICEAVHGDVPWRDEVVSECFVVEPKGRVVRPSGRPGLGVELNKAEIKKHPFEPEVVERVFYPDGSVGDW